MATGPDLLKNNRAHSGIVLWDWCEALAGLLAAFLLAFVVPTISGIALATCVFLAEWRGALIALPVFAISAPMAAWLARMSDRAFNAFRVERWAGASRESRTPFGIWISRQLPTPPFLWRFPLTLWWISHFLAGIALVEFRNVIAPAVGLPVPSGFAAIVFCFAFQFAGNIFLALAIGSAQTSSEMTESVWRYRFWINGVILLGLAARLFF